MLSVAGGKLTTYRRTGFEALDLLRSDLGLHRLDRRPFPLPGAIDPDDGLRRLTARVPELEPAVLAHLVHLYGGLADRVLELGDSDPDQLQPIHPDGPDLAAQAVYARDVEWAVRPEDVLRRRTTLALRGLSGENVVRRVEELFRTRGGEAPRAASVPSSPGR
jgi:glycerol-3-phosphate dehydrogenase